MYFVLYLFLFGAEIFFANGKSDCDKFNEDEDLCKHFYSHCIYEKGKCLENPDVCRQPYPTKKDCLQNGNCIWDNKLEYCHVIDGEYTTSYKGVKLGIYFDIYGRCFTYNSQKLINYKAGPPSTIPTCYKDFYDKALLPICGHPLYDKFKYCYKGDFFGNSDYDDKDIQKVKSILVLIDGCFFCPISKKYFSTQTVEIHISEPSVWTSIHYAVNEDGNFLIGFTENGHGNHLVARNYSMFVKHRCNKYNIVVFKIVNILIQAADKYPTRVWESINTIISLDENEQNFNQLRGKKDL